MTQKHTPTHEMPARIFIETVDAGFGNGAQKIKKWDSHHSWDGATEYVRADARDDLVAALHESNEQLKWLYDYVRKTRKLVLENLDVVGDMGFTIIQIDDLDDIMLQGKDNEKALTKAKAVQ